MDYISHKVLVGGRGGVVGWVGRVILSLIKGWGEGVVFLIIHNFDSPDL